MELNLDANIHEIFDPKIPKNSLERDLMSIKIASHLMKKLKELEKREISYKHVLAKNYLEIPKYYNALDLYLVMSRDEGGPKSIVESMATGVPIVSTEVGMAPDIIKDGYNGYLADVGDVEMLTEKVSKVLDSGNMAKKMAENGLKTVEDYSWDEIAHRYYEKIYSPLIEE